MKLGGCPASIGGGQPPNPHNQETTLTRLPRPIAVSIHGDPTTKGSMKCIGPAAGQKRHRLIEELAPGLRRWRKALDPAGTKLRELAGGVIHAPIGVELVFTFARPAAATVWERPWPSVRCGDVNKLARAVLDALTVTKKAPQLGVLADDSIVCELLARKVYPDTPDAADRLTRPGVVIRLYPIVDPPAELPYEHVLDQDEWTGR
jgi:Holliday junction resolvase RusA-like endonuclease